MTVSLPNLRFKTSEFPFLLPYFSNDLVLYISTRRFDGDTQRWEEYTTATKLRALPYLHPPPDHCVLPIRSPITTIEIDTLAL